MLPEADEFWRDISRQNSMEFQDFAGGVGGDSKGSAEGRVLLEVRGVKGLIGRYWWLQRIKVSTGDHRGLQEIIWCLCGPQQ